MTPYREPVDVTDNNDSIPVGPSVDARPLVFLSRRGRRQCALELLAACDAMIAESTCVVAAGFAGKRGAGRRRVNPGVVSDVHSFILVVTVLLCERILKIALFVVPSVEVLIMIDRLNRVFAFLWLSHISQFYILGLSLYSCDLRCGD